MSVLSIVGQMVLMLLGGLAGMIMCWIVAAPFILAHALWRRRRDGPAEERLQRLASWYEP